MRTAYADEPEWGSRDWFRGCNCSHKNGKVCPHGCHDLVFGEDKPSREMAEFFELVEAIANEALTPFEIRRNRGDGFDAVDEWIDEWLTNETTKGWES